MGMTAAHYLAQLQALLPSGMAWPRRNDANLTRLLSAWAEEFARVDARADDLIDQVDMATVAEMLTDWERVAGLPDPCVEAAGGTQGLSQRRKALTARLTSEGGLSIAYYISIAASLGYTITITEFKEFKAGLSAAGDALTNGDWVFGWRVHGPEVTVTEFAAGQSAAGEPLRSWGNELLECALSQLKPAGTHVQFAYS